MGHKLIEQMLERAEKAKNESDFYYFNTLLYAGEALVKTITFGMLAAVKDDDERNRYRLEHNLVRNNGPGDCSQVLEDILKGPASQHLLHDARKEQKELTKRCKAGEWQYDSVMKLKESLKFVNPQSESLPSKSDLERWFDFFAELRNKTRGHGATQLTVAGKAAIPLSESINIIYKNFHLFKRSWVHLYKNLSGKYRVSPLGNNTGEFDYLKREKEYRLENGIYIWWGEPKHIPFILSDAELNDFFVANGSFNEQHYELLSYNTDDKQKGDSSKYLNYPGPLSKSETQGKKELEAKGNSLTNTPDPAKDYIERFDLEKELFNLLMDDRRLIVTLHGAGGIGKTSLTLQVINKLCIEGHYDGIIWFSARDIDLLSKKIKQVSPDVFSQNDIAKYYVKLVLPDKLDNKRFNHKEFFEGELGKSTSFDKCLFVFDNFETVQNPQEMFDWIDHFIRSPNQILITTRLSDFKGDYPLEVSGMTEEEAKNLMLKTGNSLNINKSLMQKKTDRIMSLSKGHPYIIKILIGELAVTQHITKTFSTQDKALTALFERTYTSLTPCAQYAFMVLAGWSSKILKTVLEAVLISSFKDEEETEDINKAIESLYRYSLVQKTKNKDQQELIELPFTARIFGEKKLRISPDNSKIEEDVRLLHMFGVEQKDMTLNLYNRLEEFMKNVSNKIEKGESFKKYEAILDVFCQMYNPGNLLLAQFYMEKDTPSLQKAQNKLKSFLEERSNEDDKIKAWIMLSKVCKKMEDYLGYVHALVEMSKLQSTYFWKISNAANEINKLLHEKKLDIEKSEKAKLIQTLLNVLEKRKHEAQANDFSRMAWLALHTQQESKARQYVNQGLKLDPQNPYCLRLQLKDRLSR